MMRGGAWFHDQEKMVTVTLGRFFCVMGMYVLGMSCKAARTVSTRLHENDRAKMACLRVSRMKNKKKHCVQIILYQ